MMSSRPAEMTAAYEAIRAQATGELPTASPRGLTLFLGAGLPSWLRAWVPLAPAPPTASVAPTDSPPSLGLGAEVVMVLTQIALSCQRRWST